MSGVLSSVDQRTKLVGENRLELLMFRLHGTQLFAINVFKVQEVLQLSNLSAMPHRHYCVCGVTTIRGKTVPVINLSQAIGMPPLSANQNATIIVTEYNRSVQAFLVGGVERIVNMNWEQISPPPVSAGRSHYLTAITRFSNQLVEVIDVEKVLAEITPFSSEVSSELLDESMVAQAQDWFILIVDDSPVALNQAKATVEILGFETKTATNGLMAFNMLRDWREKNDGTLERCLMLLTDAEMPEMDGYRLTKEVRADPQLSDLYVVMHTSLSGSFNKAMTQKVGCDDFLSKFQPDELASVVQQRLRDVSGAV